MFRSLYHTIIYALITISAANAQSLKVFTPEELKEDASLMKNVILSMHPVIGIYDSKGKIDTIFNDFINSLTTPLNEREFRIKVRVALNNMKCGHTDLLPSKTYLKQLKKNQIYAQKYYFFPHDSQLTPLTGLIPKRDTLLKSDMIIKKINGHNADSMYQLIKKIINSDGYIDESKDYYAKIGYTNFFMHFLNYPDTVTYDYIQAGKAYKIKLPSFKCKSFPFFQLHLSKDSTMKRYKKAKMNFKYLGPEEESFYLQLTSFSNKRYTKAYRKIFKGLKKNNVANLVIDLRDNGGGSVFNSYELLKYLIPSEANQTSYTLIKRYPYKKHTKGGLLFKITRLYFGLIGKHKKNGDTLFYTLKIKPKKKWHYENKIYVLINGGSFSASCLVGAYLKERKDVTFIGQETGGTLEGSNAIITPYYTMPNTKTKLRIPTFRLMHDPIAKPIIGRGIIPDIPIKYSIEDYRKHRDLEMRKVLELLSLSKVRWN
ncbi:MAG: S41 family peptidase [Bacteroidia bacterium]